MRTATLLVLLALAGASGGCGVDVFFEKQDVILRHDVEGDALDVLLINHGVFTYLPDALSDDERNEELAKGVAAFELLAAGARDCTIGDELLRFSIDELASKDAATPSDAEAAERVAIYRLITLEDYAAFTDEQGRLCLFQRFKIQPWSEFEARANALISRDVIEGAESNARPDGEDLEGIAMRVAKANAGSHWFEFKDRQLRLDLPMTNAEYVSGVRDLFGAAAYMPGLSNLVAEVLASARELKVDDHGLSLVAGDGTAPIHWSIEAHPDQYDPTLCKALRTKGVALREDIKVSELIASMK